MTHKASQKSPAEELRQLFIYSIKDIYWTEKALTKSLSTMIDNANSEDLIDTLTDHMQTSKDHVIRLEEVFTSLGEPAESVKCEAMAGLVLESEKILKLSTEGYVRDAGIILSVQKISHYQIAIYGTLSAFARTLGENYVASLLDENLNDEKVIDGKLSEIAEAHINIEATK